jgi:hypothetical protein
MSYTKVNLHPEVLGSKKILYAVVDQAEVRNKHPKLFKKVLDITFVMTQRLSESTTRGDVRYFNTIDDAMDSSDNYDIVIVQSVGNFIRQNSFFEELNNYYKSNPSFFLLAFTLDWQSEKGEGWIEIHNQMMVVNVHTWKKLGSPKFGGWETATEELPNYIRSEENFHDRYTPYWIKGSDGSSMMTRRYPGWGFIKAALSNGMQIDNFTQRMRDCRLYIYPEHESENLYNAFLNRDESLVSNPNQKKWIKNSLSPKSTIWIYNSENYRFSVPLKYCDTYVGTAAGFKYLDILNYNDDVKFVFYDYSEESLDWIKDLKENWDGNDFPSYIKNKPLELKKKYKYINSSVEENQLLLFRDFGGEEKFKKLWNIFRSSKAEFIKCNLFDNNDLTSVLSNVTTTRPLFYYSNIFATDFTMVMFTREEADEKYRDFISTVKTQYPDSLMYGCDITGKWVVN